MNVQEAQARIKARVWKSVAQADLDLSGLDKATLEELIDLLTDAALLEIDEEIAEIFINEEKETSEAPDDSPKNSDDDEHLLWSGRPFLSATVHYEITSERIKVRHGLLGKTFDYLELIRIQDMKHSQSLSERLLKIGDITIRSHDTSHPTLELNNVQDPEHVYEILRDAVQDARKRHNFSYREEM